MQERDYLRLTVQAAPIAIVVTDDRGGIVLVNDQGERLFGYDREELLGRSIETLVPARFRGAHPLMRQGYLHSPVGRPMGAGRDLYGLRRDGTEVPIEIGLNPVQTAEGTFVLTAIIDITERKRSEEMRSQRDRAVEASKVKSQFVATMSHELRTPLTAIIGMAELLSGTDLDARQRGYVETIDRSAEALLGLISSILDFSKIEAGALDLEEREFAIETVVADAAAVVAPQARARGLRVHTYVDPLVPPMLRGDADRLRQILLNLIGNAVKFTERGTVVVRALPARVSSRNALVRFEVEDTGIGMPDDVVGKLFEPFVQADSSSSRRYGGTGLGLSISKRLAELMGGEIGVKSVAGTGSTFWFTASFPRPGVAAISRQVFGVEAVIVTTDPTLREIVERYLVSWGIRSRAFGEPAAAIACLTVAPEDGAERVVLLDSDEYPGAATFGPPVIRIGTDGDVPPPLRQSVLFDRIAEALGDAAPLQQEETHVAPARPGKLGRVLIAEDNPSLRDVLARQFEELGVAVTMVPDGRAAVEAVRDGDYALAFMDYQMPELDGLAATRAIRAEESQRSTARLPIVAMTANAFENDRLACLAAGMDDYLAKPVRIRELRKVIERWMPLESDRSTPAQESLGIT